MSMLSEAVSNSLWRTQRNITYCTGKKNTLKCLFVSPVISLHFHLTDPHTNVVDQCMWFHWNVLVTNRPLTLTQFQLTIIKTVSFSGSYIGNVLTLMQKIQEISRHDLYSNYRTITLIFPTVHKSGRSFAGHKNNILPEKYIKIKILCYMQH